MKGILLTIMVFVVVLIVSYYGFARWDVSWCIESKQQANESFAYTGIERHFSDIDREECAKVGVILP